MSDDSTTALGVLLGARLQAARDHEEAIDLDQFLRGPADVWSKIKSKWTGSIAETGGLGLRWPDPFPIECDTCAVTQPFSPDQPVDRICWMHESSGIGDLVCVMRCRGCRETTKRYAVHFTWTQTAGLEMTMYGELPSRVIPVSKRLRELVRADAELFNKALKAEAAGLGIASLVYYRRILERQKTRIFDRVIKVAERVGADDDVVDGLKAARDERQFTKALEGLNGGPLKTIYLNGHNPLTLLYDEVSEGVHAGSDAECLQRAADIRTVLGYLADRLEEILADRKEVDLAVSDMLKRRKEREEKKKSGGG